MTNQELVHLIMLAREVEHRYRLDQFEESALKILLKALGESKREVIDYAEKRAFTLSPPDRIPQLLNELEQLTAGVQSALTDDITLVGEAVSTESLDFYNNLLSFDGKVENFNFVSLTGDQLKSTLVDTPIGGVHLKEWISESFGARFEEVLKHETLKSLLQGEGYPKMVERLMGSLGDAFELTESDAITIARSYTQEINNHASLMVARANPNVVKRWRWSSVLEPGYIKTGRGTCLRCAALDGQEFEVEGGPPCPLHPRCRCIRSWVTASFRDLGLDMDEIRRDYRPYTIRPEENIDAGGMREIIEVGRHHGNFESWMKTRSAEFQANALGPMRFDLWKAGKVKMKDLVDASGNLVPIKELAG
ncbi:MAG: hypothetical protein ACLGPL_06765 [Acidobacteriota bacterium]